MFKMPPAQAANLALAALRHETILTDALVVIVDRDRASLNIAVYPGDIDKGIEVAQRAIDELQVEKLKRLRSGKALIGPNGEFIGTFTDPHKAAGQA